MHFYDDVRLEGVVVGGEEGGGGGPLALIIFYTKVSPLTDKSALKHHVDLFQLGFLCQLHYHPLFIALYMHIV